MTRDEDLEPPFSWGLDLPGLTHARAVRVIEVLRQHAPEVLGDVGDVDALLVDPRAWFSVIVDRDTAVAMRDALRLRGSDRTSTAMAENIEEWLDFAGEADPEKA